MTPRQPAQYYVPSPCSREEPTRRSVLEDKVPQAKGALDSIEQSTIDLKFGSPISAFLNNYHFPSEEEIREYFRVYLGQRDADQINEQKINRCLVDTINRRPRNHTDDRFVTDQAFSAVASELIRQVDAAGEEEEPFVKLVIGPTGAGKTAFSKALFTVCLRQLWNDRIIPSRVEFSKYQKGFRVPTGSDELELDSVFFSFVRRCQLRDLLIYFFISGTYDHQQRIDIINDLRLSSGAAEELYRLGKAVEKVVIDGENLRLSAKIRKLFTNAIDSMEDRRDSVLYKLAAALKIRFLVSFDGFDSTRIEHFLFERRESSPIYYLVRTLKGIHEKRIFDGVGINRLETHYIAYLRDTTFARLRTELFTTVGGSFPYPIQWIVPPSYQSLAQNAAVYLTRSYDPEVNLANVFSADIVGAFDRAVFEKMDLNAATHLAFVFGSSGRRMKAHIRQLSYSALERAIESKTFDFHRSESGINAKTVWLELVRNHGVRELPAYRILEGLFLDDCNQLQPKLELDPTYITERLQADDFEGLMKHILDLDEASSVFGCMLNYFYQDTIEDEHDRQPMILILIRIIQFVELNPRCRAGEVYRFLQSIGYMLPERAYHFALFVIIRAELIKWDASRGRRLITDVPLYVTTTGRIAIEKLFFSVAYISEAMLSSILTDKVLSDSLRRRVDDRGVWIMDCIHNATIALAVIAGVEQIEGRYAATNGVDLSGYLLRERLEQSFGKESRAIIRSAQRFGPRKAAGRWEDNRSKLAALRATYTSLPLLGD